jgi:hypothetical protein
MTPYQFGIKMAVAPQAMNMNAQPSPLSSGQRVEEYMRTVNQPARPPRIAPPKTQTPVMPNLNPEMLMGNNNAQQYSSSPEYNQSSNLLGSAPVGDIDVGSLDVPSKPRPSFMSSVPSNKQLMAKVTTAPRSPFNPVKPAPAPLPKPPTTDVAKF